MGFHKYFVKIRIDYIQTTVDWLMMHVYWSVRYKMMSWAVCLDLLSQLLQELVSLHVELTASRKLSQPLLCLLSLTASS